MKRFIFTLLSFILVFAVAFVGVKVMASHSVTKTTLYAGQNIDVGEVHVWNDSNNLYVKYLIDKPGWEMKESHLFAGSLENVPKTKTGNPIPGLFPFKRNHNPHVTTYTYTIKKSQIKGSPIIIAAHASLVKKTEVTIKPKVYWTRSNENNILSTSGYGGNWTYGNVVGGFTDMTGTVWDNGAYDTSNPVIPGINYASWLYKFQGGGSYKGSSDVRLFRGTFNIPYYLNITEAKLGVEGYVDRIPINDNVYVYANGNLVMWGGTRAATIGTHNGTAGTQALRSAAGTLMESDRWYIPGTFPTITNLVKGKNKIEVFTEENERWGGMGKLNLTLTGYKIDQESAWGAGTRFVQRGNWATYFNYVWVDHYRPRWRLLETVTVPSDGSVVMSNTNLKDGDNYRLIATGTYRFVNWGEQGIADAKYSFRTVQYLPASYLPSTEPKWVDGNDLEGAWKNYLQIWINGAPTNWINNFNTHHRYRTHVNGSGAPISMFIKDNYYGDNSGSLTVRIYKFY